MMDAQQEATARWFIFAGNKLLLKDKRIPCCTSKDFAFEIQSQHEIGGDSKLCYYAAGVADDITLGDGMALVGLRQLYGKLSEADFWMAARAVQIIDWDRTHQFCSQCGTKVTTSRDEHVKICPDCHLRMYPRLAPAVIMSVTKEDKILLASNVRYRDQTLYSVLAGFVEPGETLEQAVIREVKEETGIDVENIGYFRSQPWPFPHSLMVAFTAEYAGGSLSLQEDELRAADWFTVDNLPTIPQRPSVAYDLIQHFVQRQQKVD